MQHDGAGVAHEVRIWFRQYVDVVTGGQQPVDEVAVEPRLKPQIGVGRAPGPAEQPARRIDRLFERYAEAHVAA